jgi:hypothetical protein
LRKSTKKRAQRLFIKGTARDKEEETQVGQGEARSTAGAQKK